jgi:hypothetical protein
VPEIISTTVSPSHRAITLLLNTGETARYALVRRSTGDVHWSSDTFVVDEREGTGLQWERHHGRVTVGEVLRVVPQCARDIERWTREELEEGADLPDLDIVKREKRRRALARLREELDEALARTGSLLPEERHAGRLP